MLYAKIKKRSKSESSLEEAAACSVIQKCITIDVGELNGSVKQRQIVQVECRGNQFTMPRRRRFKPRKDCVAILGKLSLFPYFGYRSSQILWVTHFAIR